MKKKTRKYVKTAAWYKAHSPKAREQRRIAKLARVKPAPKYTNGSLVWHVDNLAAAPSKIEATAYTGYGYEYALRVESSTGLGHQRRNCMEKEIVDANERIRIMRTQREQAKGAIGNRDLQIGVLKDQLHEANKRIAVMVEQANARITNEVELRKSAADYEQRLGNLRMDLAEWNQAFPGLTAQQAKAKMDQLQNDRNGMMGASNTCIAEANKLRQVNAKLVEVITLLTR